MRLRVIGTSLVVWLVPQSVIACSVCFGGADGALLHGARVGVLAMAGVTAGVLAAFARWFLRLRRLEREQNS
jgi:hypothetical protein